MPIPSSNVIFTDSWIRSDAIEIFRYVSEDPDAKKVFTDPRIRMQKKYSRICRSVRERNINGSVRRFGCERNVDGSADPDATEIFTDQYWYGTSKVVPYLSSL